ncbi:MAG TPA: flagellar hook-length control protein FliK [Scandinavium sp.]|jgi:flagellar hook-length control protein FliK
MQLTKAFISPESVGKNVPSLQNAVASSDSPAKQTAVNYATDATTGSDVDTDAGFDNTLAALLTALTSKGDSNGAQRSEKRAEADEKQPVKDAENTEDAGAAILEALLTASQHPVTSTPLKSSGEGVRQKGDAQAIQTLDATTVRPTQLSALQAQVAQPQSDETTPVSSKTDSKDVASASVKQLMTQPLAVSAQDMAALQGGTSSPTTGVTTSAISSQDTALQATGTDANNRFSLPAVKLSDEGSRWSDQLQSALGDRLQLQVKDKIQHATIRLDPPDMGKIDISMQIENGRMQVHIQANHGEVYRSLQQISHELRQSLVEQNFVQVNVQVSSQHPGQQQGQRQNAFAELSESVLAGSDMAGDEQYSSHQDDESILLKV